MEWPLGAAEELTPYIHKFNLSLRLSSMHHLPIVLVSSLLAPYHPIVPSASRSVLCSCLAHSGSGWLRYYIK